MATLITVPLNGKARTYLVGHCPCCGFVMLLDSEHACGLCVHCDMIQREDHGMHIPQALYRDHSNKENLFHVLDEAGIPIKLWADGYGPAEFVLTSKATAFALEEIPF